MGVEAAVRETPSLTREFIGETNRVLECTKAHPPRNQHQKGPICLWVAGAVTENGARAKQAALFLLGPFPDIQSHTAAMFVGCPTLVRQPKALPLYT